MIWVNSNDILPQQNWQKLRWFFESPYLYLLEFDCPLHILKKIQIYFAIHTCVTYPYYQLVHFRKMSRYFLEIRSYLNIFGNVLASEIVYLVSAGLQKITQKSDGIKGWNNYFRPFLFGLSKNIGGIYRPSYPTHLLWSIIARRLIIATIPRCLIFMPQRPLVIWRQTPEQWRHPPGYQRVKLRDWLLGL